MPFSDIYQMWIFHGSSENHEDSSMQNVAKRALKGFFFFFLFLFPGGRDSYSQLLRDDHHITVFKFQTSQILIRNSAEETKP